MRLFLYLIGVVFTGYMMVMYDSPWCMELIAFELLVLAAGFLLTRHMKHSVHVDFSVKNNVVQKGSQIPVHMLIKNHSRLPISYIQTDILLQHENSDTIEHYHVNGAVDGRGETSVELYLESGYCGVVHIKAVMVRVRDYLKVFECRQKCDICATVLVIPEIYPTSMDVVSGFRYFTGEGDVYSDTDSGDDPSEVFEIRSYRPGDKMQKIHWKLSARTDEMYVREYSEPVGYAVVLLLDCSGKTVDETVYDALMSVVFSMSNRLILDGYSHYIAWMNEDGKWFRFRVGSEDALYGAMPYMLKSMAGKGKMDAADAYNKKYGRYSYHTMIVVDSRMNVYRNGLLERTLDAFDLKESLLNMNLEI